MLSQQPKPGAQLQRVQVEAEPGGPDRRVKVRVESYDELLGWYTSGSLSLGLHQLPLLEQAIQTMRSWASCDETPEEQIIPFPGRVLEASRHTH